MHYIKLEYGVVNNRLTMNAVSQDSNLPWGLLPGTFPLCLYVYALQTDDTWLWKHMWTRCSSHFSNFTPLLLYCGQTPRCFSLLKRSLCQIRRLQSHISSCLVVAERHDRLHVAPRSIIVCSLRPLWHHWQGSTRHWLLLLLASRHGRLRKMSHSDLFFYFSFLPFFLGGRHYQAKHKNKCDKDSFVT